MRHVRSLSLYHFTYPYQGVVNQNHPLPYGFNFDFVSGSTAGLGG
jgi:hypothetical protein